MATGVGYTLNVFTGKLDAIGTGSGGGGSGIETINGQSPISNNYDLTSVNLGITNTTGSTDIEDLRYTTQYVVDPSTDAGTQGTYTTLGAAISALSGREGTIFLRPSIILHESVTVPANVTIVGYGQGDSQANNAVLVGTLTLPTQGRVTLSNFSIKPNKAPCIVFTGPSGINSEFNVIRDMLLVPNVQPAIECSVTTNCLVVNTNMIIPAASEGTFMNIMDGNFVWQGGYMKNGGPLSAFANDIQIGGTAIFSMQGGTIEGFITASSNAIINLIGTTWSRAQLSDSSSLSTESTISTNSNSTDSTITLNDTSTYFSSFDTLESNGVMSAGVINIASSGATATISESALIFGGFGNVISGSGNLIYNHIDFVGSNDSLDPGLSITINPTRPYSTADVDNTTAIRGHASFNSLDFNDDGTGFISLNTQPGFITAYTAVDFSMSPYTVLTTDQFISVDSSGGAITLNFPDSPTSLETWIVKDRTGNANTNNITLTTVSGTPTFDGQISEVLMDAYDTTQLLADPSANYELF